VRARIGALSTLAGEWAALAETWVAEASAPDEHCAYLVLQTLAGCWPIEPERLEAYVEKALREAKLRTSWAEPDEAYEAAARAYARGLVERPPDGFVAFAGRVAAEGRRAALGQLLLKLTSPGVPDVYQGDELEALSLVDPDNRRPVDWEARRAALARLQPERRRATSASASSTSSAARWPCARAGRPLRRRLRAGGGGPRASAPTCAAARSWSSCRA
jgi:(1->4)-alpha-D-glucan 1-alpha-D-glucosylmutase